MSNELRLHAFTDKREPIFHSPFNRIQIMRLAFVVAIAAVLALDSAEAASAASCSGWRAICLKRAGSRPEPCESKFRTCLSSGCFAEIPQFGGANHSGLAKE
jgi:hypothetical protein